MDKIHVDKNIISNYKRGLDTLREKFKHYKFINNYDGMADAIENLKSELKSKMIQADEEVDIKRIEKICQWYRSLETKYTIPSPDGYKLIFPPNIEEKINHNLMIAYEILVGQMDKLGLL